MPIDPSIALQVRPIQIEAPDPIRTLLTVAQLRGMQADQDLKQLQMADLAGKLQTYQALSRPGGPLSQLTYGAPPDQGQVQPSPLRARPGGGPGALGAGAPLGGGAPAGQPGQEMARPVTPEERAAIGQGGQVGQAGLSPEDQAKYDEIRGRSQEQPYVPQSSPASVPTAGFAPYRGMSESAASAPPQASVAQSSPLAGRPAQAPFQGATTGPQVPMPSTQDPSQPGVGPNALTRPQGQGPLNPVQEVERRVALYQQLMSQYRPDVTGPIVANLMALDQHGLAVKKGALEFQATGQGMIAQAMNAVQASADPAQAYVQTRQMLIQMGIPGVEQQLPDQYNSQLVNTLGTQALTAQQRAEQHIKLLDQANKTYENRIKAFEQETKAREVEMRDTMQGPKAFPKYPGAPGAIPATPSGLSPEAYSKLTEQERLELQSRETGYTQTAEGGIVPTPKYLPPQGAAPGGAGGQGGIRPGVPMVNPQTGQPLTSLEALQRQREWQNSLGQQYNTQAQPMQEASLSMGVIRNSLTPPKGQENANDTGLLTNFIRLLNPSTGRDIQAGKATDFSMLGPVSDRIQRLWDRVSKGGVLSPEDRKFLGDYAEKVYGQYSQDYEKNLLNPTRERAKQFPGVDPVRDVPDVRTGATPRRLATEKQIQDTLADAKARGIPKTREQVLEALRQQGYDVVGGKR